MTVGCFQARQNRWTINNDTQIKYIKRLHSVIPRLLQASAVKMITLLASSDIHSFLLDILLDWIETLGFIFRKITRHVQRDWQISLLVHTESVWSSHVASISKVLNISKIRKAYIYEKYWNSYSNQVQVGTWLWCNQQLPLQIGLMMSRHVMMCHQMSPC